MVRVVSGNGELRKVAFHIHARIHLMHPHAACVLHVHPQYLTALSLLEEPELALAHQNNLLLNDRMAVDLGGVKPVHDNDEGDRIAALLGDKSILVMASHGVTVVGPTVHDAFDELYGRSGPACIRSPRCPPAGDCASCLTVRGGAGTAPGATSWTRGCIWTPGAACWIARNPITRPEPQAAAQ